MTKLTYNQFIEIISNYDVFDKKKLLAMYDEFGKNRINDYFDRYYQSIEEENLSEFIKRYSAYFDEQKIYDDVDTDYLKADDSIAMILLTIAKFPVMSSDFEYEQGLIIENSKKDLKIIKQSDDEYKLYPNLDIEKLLLSINNMEDVKSLKKLTNLPLVLDDSAILKKEMFFIKKYIDFCNVNNRIANLDELKSLFIELDFDNVDKIENVGEQIELLKKYIVAKYNYYYRNLKLVFYIAKKGGFNPLSVEDKWQEGCIGLIKAINKFKASKGYKFSTYSTWWIKQSIVRAIADKGYVIRKPVHVAEHIRSYELFVQKYKLINGINPSLEEAAEALDFSVEYVYKLQQYFTDTTSLDEKCCDFEHGDEKINFVIDDDAFFEDKVASKDLIDRIINEMNDTFSERINEILCYRWGLNKYEKKYTLEELGQMYGVTRERIRQIEARAKSRLAKKLISKKIVDQNKNNGMSY